MGWLFPYDAHTKEILVKDILGRNNTTFNDGTVTLKVLKHTLKGNNLWLVIERHHPATEKFGSRIVYIVLYKLAFDRDENIWGYKDMDASMGPYESDCPVKFFDLVTEDCKISYYPDFEKRVRERSKRISSESKSRNQIEFDDIVIFTIPLTFRAFGGEVNGIKVSYQQKKTTAGYAVNKDGKFVGQSVLLLVPNIRYWEKIIKKDGTIIEMGKKEEVAQ